MAPAFQNWWGFLGSLMECVFNGLPDPRHQERAEGEAPWPGRGKTRFQAGCAPNRPHAPGQFVLTTPCAPLVWSQAVRPRASKISSSPDILCLWVPCVPNGFWTTAGHIFKQNCPLGQQAFITHFCPFLCFEECCWEGGTRELSVAKAKPRVSIRPRLKKGTVSIGKLQMTFKKQKRNNRLSGDPCASAPSFPSTS